IAAWREVAKRIAHEIKNPLTPIQLCAQRIEKRFLSDKNNDYSCLSEKDKEVLTESTQLITKQVETLRILVNEFSRFASLPKAEFKERNINVIIKEAVRLYENSYSDIIFIVSLE